MICEADKSIIKCPHMDAGSSCLNPQSGCGFRKEESVKTTKKKEYVRKPRWYEQYYK